MKKFIIQPLLLLTATLLMCCSSQSDVQEAIGLKLESFSIQCGPTIYKGIANQVTKEVSIGGIVNRNEISGVSYVLSPGTTISPDPQAIERWELTQTFTITSPDNEQVSYTVKLPDLKEASDKRKAVVIGYIPASDFEFDEKFGSLKWEYLTHINVCFVQVKANGSLETGKVIDRIDAIREKAHNEGVKVLISLQSYGGDNFTQAFTNADSRKTLVRNIIAFVRAHELDGFDIDYEEYTHWNFPGLLTLAKELHEAKDEGMLMTCAVGYPPYSKEWHQYFDYINLMTYDNGVYTKNPAQHASYDFFVSEMNRWLTTYETPKSKIVGGLAFYGYKWRTGATAGEAVRFCDIIQAYGAEAADVDDFGTISAPAGRTLYNGRPITARKCQYVNENEFAGVMIWQLLQDAHEDNLKLLEVVGREMKEYR